MKTVDKTQLKDNLLELKEICLKINRNVKIKSP